MRGGLEKWAALLYGDYSPMEYAEQIAACGFLPSADYYDSWMRAGKLFRSAASLQDPEDAEPSLFLMGRGKEALREALLTMMDDRICPCCLALRKSLRSKKGKRQ